MTDKQKSPGEVAREILRDHVTEWAYCMEDVKMIGAPVSVKRLFDAVTATIAEERERADKLVEALEFYEKVPARRESACHRGVIWIDNDQGGVARQALAEYRKRDEK